MTKHLFRSLALAFGIAALGCGSKAPEEKSAIVTGKVTLAGKPLPGGTINFRSTIATHRLGAGDIKADGTFEVKDAPQGACKVFVTNFHLKPMDKSSGYIPPEGTKLPPPGSKYVPIPPKYTSETTTDITADVNADPFTFNVELK